MILSSISRAHAQACGISMEDAARMVAESHQAGKQPTPRSGDDGINPYQQFRERLARPNPDLPQRRRTYDLD